MVVKGIHTIPRVNIRYLLKALLNETERIVFFYTMLYRSSNLNRCVTVCTIYFVSNKIIHYISNLYTSAYIQLSIPPTFHIELHQNIHYLSVTRAIHNSFKVFNYRHDRRDDRGQDYGLET